MDGLVSLLPLVDSPLEPPPLVSLLLTLKHTPTKLLLFSLEAAYLRFLISHLLKHYLIQVLVMSQLRVALRYLRRQVL